MKKKHTFKIEGFEIIEKTAKAGSSNSARLYVPKAWNNKKVLMVRTE